MNEDRLYLLWTNADPVTSQKMVLMYAANSMINSWWSGVTVILWGAPSRLAAENAEIQKEIREAQRVGVRFSACKACADQMNVTEKLLELGIEVIYWGEPLTELLKQNQKVLTI